MPWEKTFDTEQAIASAMQVFWAKGYKSTSMADLLAATGLNKGSFYNAFGSKKQMFSACLEKYEQQETRDLLDRLAAKEQPLEAIEAFFDALLELGSSDTERKGCMLVNTALDFPNHDQDTQQKVVNSLAGVEQFFYQQIRLGQQQGMIQAQVDAAAMAQTLLTLSAGIRVLTRGVLEYSSITGIKAQALALLKNV